METIPLPAPVTTTTVEDTNFNLSAPITSAGVTALMASLGQNGVVAAPDPAGFVKGSIAIVFCSDGSARVRVSYATPAALPSQ